MESELIESTVLAGFDALVEELGGTPEALFKTTGVIADTLTKHDSFIPFKSYCQLMELAAQETQTPEFGLLLGSRQNLSAVGVVGAVIGQTRSYAELLSTIKQYFSVHNHCVGISLQRYENITQLTRSTITSTDYTHTQVTMKSIAATMQILKTLFGAEWHPLEVCFDFSMLGMKRTFERILHAPVVFNHPETCIMFRSPRVKNDFSTLGENPASKQILLNHLNQQVAERGDRFAAQVQQKIKTSLSTGDFSKETVAASFSMSSRKLQQKLADNDTSFRLLLEDTRKNTALQYLSHTTLSLTEIAEIIGYTDLSAFSRAFKSWCGASPQRWRNENSIR